MPTITASWRPARSCATSIATVPLTTCCRGHGTLVFGTSLQATVSGTVEHVNKLVTVRAVHSRYRPEVGDVVVGRVIEVSGKRWRLQLGSRGEAGLLLSAVDLPGGVQRRRTAEDELSMRSVFKEGDLLSAEVCVGRGFLHVTPCSCYGTQALPE